MEKKVDKNIYKRGEFSFRVKMMVGGHTINETFDTLSEAQTFRDSKLVAIELDPDFKKILGARIRKRDAQAYTLTSALERYEREVTVHKKSKDTEHYKIAKILRYPIAQQSFYSISAPDVMSFLNAFRADGASDSTGRKYVSIISHLYKIARKRWQLPVINPVDSIERPCNGKPRKRRLNDGEEEKLIAEFMKEDHKYILPAFLFSVNTAMRRGELLRMEWKHTHFFEDGTGIAHLPETKNDDSRDVPLDLVAVRILKSLRDLDKESAMVFCITQYQLRTRWERVRGAAGLRDLRWHDLRHESTSRFIELGLNVLEAASITGHKTLQMLMDYTHLRAKKLAKKIDELKAV